MRIRRTGLRGLLGLTGLAGLAWILSAMATIDTLKYPPARRQAQIDDYHGIRVPDPYRWLEDIDSADTQRWLAAQDRLSREFLDSIPGRAAIAERLREMWSFERWTPPVRYGNCLLYTSPSPRDA